MSAQAGSTNVSADKGKGKSVAEPQDVTMGEGDDSSSEDDDAPPPAEEVEEEASDNEIDKSNIIQGRRTRGKKIDFAAAAKDLPAEDDEDEDDDFQSEGEDDDEMGGN
ncbi:8ea809d7-3c52-4614-b5c0-8e0c49f0cfa4 [Sclerotinia trifoliorum]|uniref:8ea809d7-3c52-4614-b5c0-8e0c49f0cfa4 n=1 Tax=Sclerotinia trifoliorum TaxID=28548 RepID=A0A8H2ZUS8_9HELO|nr:8ea809d7-3c52-4614-b5c0-8e0c49f0cfa4 [Sclerotinia trifoliorum]